MRHLLKEHVCFRLIERLGTKVEIDPEIIDQWDLKKSQLSEVVLFSNGTNIMPAVSCNGQKINPAIPEFPESDSEF